jgi:hypothetical protein
MEDDKMPNVTPRRTESRPKMFLDIPTAAAMAGFSLRHFRRIIEEDRIPIMQIGRKFFILGRDFTNWRAGTNKDSRDFGALSKRVVHTPSGV